MDPADSSEFQKERAASLLEREYEYVSGLIPFYRRVELFALAATGVIVTSALAAVAVLEASDQPRSDAAGTLLAAAAWASPFLLLIQAMAVIRLRRAAIYIRDRLRPLAIELTGEERVLGWEVSYESRMRLTGRPGHGVTFIASMLPPLAAGLALVIGGVALNASTLTILLGGSAALASTLIAGYVLRQNVVAVATGEEPSCNERAPEPVPDTGNRR